VGLLVDLLPTVMGLAGRPVQSANEMKLDGTSLLPLFQSSDTESAKTEVASDASDERVAISDFLAIGRCVPCRMVRKGRYKYFVTHGCRSIQNEKF